MVDEGRQEKIPNQAGTSPRKNQNGRAPKKLAIYGGSFDPIHIGHLLAAESAYELLDLDRVDFVPAFDPPHKEGKANNVQDRVKMLDLAIQDVDHFALNTSEVERGEVSYSYDTVKRILNDQPATQLYMIIGQDSAMEIKTWYRWEDLLALVDLVVVVRPDRRQEDFHRAIQDLREAGYRVHVVDKVRVDLSSTEVRKFVREGRSIRFMVPEPVRSYILDHGLYQKSSEENK